MDTAGRERFALQSAEIPTPTMGDDLSPGTGPGIEKKEINRCYLTN